MLRDKLNQITKDSIIKQADNIWHSLKNDMLERASSGCFEFETTWFSYKPGQIEYIVELSIKEKLVVSYENNEANDRTKFKFNWK